MSDHAREAVEVLEHVEIPMADGCRLSARIWLPVTARDHPVPAILEYIPYRKRDFKAVRDAGSHGYFACHGYAGVRVDLRGSGDSEGALRDEYLPQELDDGLRVIRWLAEQPWCNGRVGLFGLSWGGLNGLQLAALQPPELGAVITVCSSDDRYADDVHYMGGCLLTDNLSWASTMFAYNSCPPDPAVVGERWRDMWLERLEASGLWIEQWLRHQCRDDYWRHGSVCEDYNRIRCPVFAVSGWADGYTNSVFRLMQNLAVPCRGLIGPWGHKYPHTGEMEPTIDFLGECVRWWDRWLGSAPAGNADEGRLQVWMQHAVSPLEADRPGRWIAVDGWPAPEVETRECGLSRHGLTLDTQPAEHGESSIISPLSVGLFAGKWCSYAEDADLPADQREEDGGSLVFDSPVLEQDLHILGAPTIELELTADRPQAMVAVRLSDVAPSGQVTRVTYGLLNLSHRDSHEHPEPLEPGRWYRVRVALNHVAQRFHAGHRLRLAISTSYWPLAWPAPEPWTLQLRTAGSRLLLPVYTPRPDDGAPRSFGPPERGPLPPTTLLRPAVQEWNVNYNLRTMEAALQVTNNDALYRLDDVGLTLQKDVRERFSSRHNDYATVRAEVESVRSIERDDWRIRTITRTVLTSTPTHFQILATLDAYEGDARIFARSWDERIARDHV